MFTRTGRDFVVSGATRPVVTARAGRIRLRLLNATAGDHLLLAVTAVNGKSSRIHLIATDAGLIERPVPLTEILLAPGERAEILVATTTPGRLTLRVMPYSVYGDGGQQSTDRALAGIDIPADLAPIALPASPARGETCPSTDVRTRRIVLNGAGDGSFTIDGRTFDHDRVDLRAGPRPGRQARAVPRLARHRQYPRGHHRPSRRTLPRQGRPHRSVTPGRPPTPSSAWACPWAPCTPPSCATSCARRAPTTRRSSPSGSTRPPGPRCPRCSRA